MVYLLVFVQNDELHNKHLPLQLNNPRYRNGVASVLSSSKNIESVMEYPFHQDQTMPNPSKLNLAAHYLNDKKDVIEKGN